MYIVDVIPFSKSLNKDSLSYFSNKPVPLGSIVTIELRKKLVKGLAIESRELSTEEKISIKQSSFSLKKIRGISKTILFQESFLKSAQSISKYFATRTGAVISSLIPTSILENVDKIDNPKKSTINNTNEPIRKFIIQSNTSERYSQYKNLIRSEFAKKKSVLFICPTVEDTIFAKENLSKGIEEHCFVLNSLISKKQVIESWNKIITREKPTLIICTPVFIGIPRHDIGYIILEKESSNTYRTQKQPYIDIRRFAENYANESNIKLLLGDIMLRSETLWRFDEHHFDELNPLKFRSLSSAKQLVIDMKKDKSNAGEMFQVLSNEVLNLIKENKENNQQTFLFGARKGLAPSIVCEDCGTIVKCHDCSSSMVLHGKDPTQKGNYFKCHVCGEERNAGEKCAKCDSWKLNTLGIGLDTIAYSIKDKFPEQKIFIINSDNAKTHKQAKIIIDEFYKTPGSILIGTEMALLYLREPIENAAIVTIDSLFSLPDFSVRERIMRIILRIRARSTHKFFIQTRRAEDPIFDLAIRGNLADFYREEFKIRKQLNYPPFSILIKLSIAGKKLHIEKEMEQLKKFFEPFELLLYQAFIQEQKGKFIMNGVIRLNREKWIDEKLLEKLRAMPPYCKVVVEAESLL